MMVVIESSSGRHKETREVSSASGSGKTNIERYQEESTEDGLEKKNTGESSIPTTDFSLEEAQRIVAPSQTFSQRLQFRSRSKRYFYCALRLSLLLSVCTLRAM